ncbi:MAG: hypothetical protein WCC16_09775, partial [Candidatus Sulfotelmatobacter sp.]
PSIPQNIWNQQLADNGLRISFQNIHNKDLIDQNLESIGLTGGFSTAGVLADITVPASSAGTMMQWI